MSQPRKPPIYLPIEIKAREFQGKLLFALVAAEAGHRVTLGRQRELVERLHVFPPGLYIDKSCAVAKRTWFRRCRGLGNTVMAWDEEGLVIHEDQYVGRRISSEAFDELECFFAWGRRQADVIGNSLPNAVGKIVTTGNPRFDLLRSEARGFFEVEAERLRKQHGPSILVNTNFGFANHFQGCEVAKKMFLATSTDISEEFVDGWIEFQKQLFDDFAELVSYLADRREQLVVLRPHPSESIETWRERLGQHDHILITAEGSVQPWILASEAMVHSNCTTGIEAFMLGRPAIAYRSVESSTYEPFLPNEVSLEARTRDEVGDLLSQMSDQALRARSWETLRGAAAEYIEGIDGPWASEAIVECLGGLRPRAGRTVALHRQALRVHGTLRALRNRLKRFGSNGRSPDYRKHKFPDLPAREMAESILRLQHATQRFEGAGWRQVGDTLYEIWCSEVDDRGDSRTGGRPSRSADANETGVSTVPNEARREG